MPGSRMRSTLLADNPAQTGLYTAYHDSQTHGYPLVMVHGFTGSKLDFHDQMEWLEDIARVIVPDNRGHGESAHLAPYSLDQMVDDLMGFLNAINVHRCTLFGHSMGGMIAMRAVLQHPDWFTSLILMDTTPTPFAIFPDDSVRKTLLDAIRTGGCEALVDSMRSQPLSAAQQRGHDFIGEEEAWRRIRTKLRQMDPQAFADLGDEMATQNVLDAIPEIDCPTTILVGEHDEPFIEPSREMAARIPTAKLEVIRHAAHSPQHENADAWKHAVRQHLLANST